MTPIVPSNPSESVTVEIVVIVPVSVADVSTAVPPSTEVLIALSTVLVTATLYCPS
jgi:hypothetical protein